MKKKRYWAGIVNGKIDKTEERHNWNVIMAIYPYRKTAELYYECVKPVYIELSK